MNDDTFTLNRSKRGSGSFPEDGECCRFLADSIPHIVWTARPDGAIDFFNRHWYDYTRLTAEQSRGDGWHSVLHLDDRRGLLDLWARSVQRGASFETRCRLRRASDGAFRWHIGRAEPRKSEPGAIVQWVGTWTDVDDQQRAEEAEIAALRLLRSIGENAADLIFACDMDRCLTFLSSGTGNFMGYRLALGSQLPFPRWVHPEDQERLARLWDSLFLGRQFRDEEFRLITASGEAKWCTSSCSPLLAEDGLQIGVQGHIRDISDRRWGEERFRSLSRAIQETLKERVAERTAELVTANKDLEAFGYSVSHDLRAPLRAIDGFSRVLLDGHSAALTAQGRHYLQRISTGAQRMGVLIDELLRFSRLGRQPVIRRPIATAELVAECLADLSDERRDRDVEVIVESLLPCEGDRELLRQVWTNLLANAFKYTQKKDRARIEIGCANTGKELTYHVRDNGAGFDMRHIDKLFGVFQRLHPAKEYEGVGIGLALVKRILQRHGGRIWAEAEPEKGATFSFTLPLPAQA